MSSGEETVRVWIGTGDPPPDAPTVTISSEDVWRASDVIGAATMVVAAEDGVVVVTVHPDGSSTVRPIEDFPLVDDHLEEEQP